MGKKVRHTQPPRSKEIMTEMNYLGDLLSNNTKIIQIGQWLLRYEVMKFEGNAKSVKKVKSSNHISATIEWIWLKFGI